MEHTVLEDALKLTLKKVSWVERLSAFWATGCLVGFVPKAPGTAGSFLGGVAFYVWGRHLPMWGQLAVGLVFLVTGIGAIQILQKKAGPSDDQRIVIDEVVGQWLALIGIFDVWAIVLGFGLFRLFDIVKIYPANYFDENRKDGLGIVMDDVISGIYARSVLAFIFVAMKLL